MVWNQFDFKPQKYCKDEHAHIKIQKFPKQSKLFIHCILLNIVQVFRKIRYEIIKFARAHATTHEIAYGAAIGTFISIFPTFGAGTFLVILFYRFVKFNLVAAISGSMISNVFTAPFFLLLSYKLGAILWKPENTLNIKNWYKNLDEVGISVFTGSFFLSLVSSLFIYVLVKYSVEYYRKHKMKVPHLS